MTPCAVRYDVIYHPSMFEDVGGWQPVTLFYKPKHNGKTLRTSESSGTNKPLATILVMIIF